MWRRLLRRSLRVAVSLLVRTLPMFRTAQTLHNTNKASEQTTDLHRSLGTPRGGPLCNVAGAHRVAAADEETPMQLLKLCYPNIPPRLILSYFLDDLRTILELGSGLEVLSVEQSRVHSKARR